MAVRAKFYIAAVEQYASQMQKGWAPPAPVGNVTMRPVSRGEENAEWASATPTGEFKMTVRGDALPWFRENLGKEVFIHIDLASPEETGDTAPEQE